jgi:hypothetical protein
MTEDDAVMQAILVGDPSPEIVALESRLRLAQLNADVDELDRLIADELLFTGPDGSIGTKQQDIDAHATGVVRFRQHAPRELRIRRIGTDVVMAALRTHLIVEVAGKLNEGVYCYTRVWAREGRLAAWRIVGGHVAAASNVTS